MSLPSVVIIGAGFGGIKATHALAGAPCTVTLVDRNNYHLFQPLLYQVATAGLSPADIAQPTRMLFRNQKNVQVLMSEVTGVDRNNHLVHHSGGTLHYDFLVLATGSVTNYFRNPQWSAHSLALKTLEDATRIRARILSAFEAAELTDNTKERQKLLTFIVIGGGPTGVEMAGAIAELARMALKSNFRHIDPQQAKIILLEGGERLLPSFPPLLSEKAEKSLQRMSVDVRKRTLVQDISARGVRLESEWLEAATIIWAAGVRSTPVADWLHVSADSMGRLSVLPDLSLPEDSSVFIVGDSARVLDASGAPLPGVAPVAMQQGRYVGQHLKRKLLNLPSEKPFVYVNKGNLATIGRSSAVAHIHSFQKNGWVAWFLWIVIHIWYLNGFRNRMMVMLQWIWAYWTFQRGARLITHQRD